MDVKDFRARLKTDKIDDILVNVLLSDDAIHCSEENKDFIKGTLANNYRVDKAEVRLIIVGSAKLGFSISEKKMTDGTVLERYRPFRPTSDIDVAVICPRIYELIWTELSFYSLNQPYQPWDSGKLGDYMVCGWLRPDHFPKNKNLRKCDDWWNIFYFLSRQPRLRRRTIRGGLFYNFEQLKYYHSKALRECIDLEK